MAGVVELPVKAFLVNRPDDWRMPHKASLEPMDGDGSRLLLKLPEGEEWVVERETLDFVLRSVDDHLEHRRAAA